jgi:hypothetical protein
MIPSVADLQSLRSQESVQQFEEIGQKLDDIKVKIEEQKKLRKPAKKPKKKSEWDWTQSYSDWSNWEDLEDLENKRRQEENRLESLSAKRDVMQHQHDHSIEKEFFDLPESVKMKKCDDHRYVGNYLFAQGSFARAAERYEIAVAFYEYCFPDTDTEQENLDNLRYVCLCNVSLCYIRLGWYRKAIESANQVLQDAKQVYPKALFRRAQAYRYLDEYEYVVDYVLLLYNYDPLSFV